jgi:hypothetical protein
VTLKESGRVSMSYAVRWVLEMMLTSPAHGLVAVGLSFEYHPLARNTRSVPAVVLVDLIEVEVCGSEPGEEEERREDTLHVGYDEKMKSSDASKILKPCCFAVAVK